MRHRLRSMSSGVVRRVGRLMPFVFDGSAARSPVFLEATARRRCRLPEMKGSYGWVARLACAGAMLAAPAVRAQQADETRAPQAEDGVHSGWGVCAPVPTEAADSSARADALLQRFQCLFESQQYQACLPVLEQACNMKDSPRCLFNLALVHHALLHCETALGYYRAYLERDPYDVGRDQALSALADLEDACGKHEPAPLLPPRSVAIVASHEQGGAGAARPAPSAALPGAPVVAAQDGVSARRVVAFSTLGAGAASAIAMGAFLIYGARADADAHDRIRQSGGFYRDDPEATALDGNGRRYNTLAWVFFGGSVALLGTSVTLFVLDAKATQSVSVSTEGFTSVRYQGSF